MAPAETELGEWTWAEGGREDFAVWKEGDAGTGEWGRSAVETRACEAPAEEEAAPAP